LLSRRARFEEKNMKLALASILAGGVIATPIMAQPALAGNATTKLEVP